MTDTKLGPVFVVTDRLAELATFYDGLGLSATGRDPGHHVWYDAGGHDLVLHVPRPEPGVDFMPSSRGTLLWFGVTERKLEELAGRWRDAGVTCWGPFDGGERRLLYALDPDGNAVGVFAATGVTPRASQ